MKWISAVLKTSAIAALLIVGVAGSATVTIAEEYRLGVQDRLRIYVSEWPALTGEVVVGASGEVSLPVVGQVPAADLSTADLAQAIAQRLKDKANLLQLPDTSVDIVAYRPFYILGGVATPGEYTYRPGMLVLNAISIAGGLYRTERQSEWDIERVAIGSRGEMSVLALRRLDLLAEKTRLNAELEDAEAFPDSPADAESHFLRALEEQRSIFKGGLEQRRSARASLESMIASREKEIASIARQIDDAARKLKTTETELEQVRALAKRNLAVNRLFPLEREHADVLREQQELEIRRLQAQEGLESLRRSLADLDEQRRNGALAGIQRVNAELRAVDEQRRALAQMLDGAAYYSSRLEAGARDDEVPQIRFTIVRVDGDEVTEMEATETTRVLPGDIVKVSRIMPNMIVGAIPGEAPTGKPAPAAR